MSKSKIVKYQPQYRLTSEEPWYNACDYCLSEEEALKLVKASPHKYTGPTPSHRIKKTTEEVLEIIVESKYTFKENK